MHLSVVTDTGDHYTLPLIEKVFSFTATLKSVTRGQGCENNGAINKTINRMMAVIM